MASEQYRIPWAPLDITQAVNGLLGDIQQRRENRRADEYLRLASEDRKNTEKRISNEEARRIDSENRRRAIEAFNAGPAVRRLARQSVAEANANPYGFKFEERYDLPANVEGPELSPSAEAARFALGRQAPVAHVQQPVTGDLNPAEEGPERNPMAEAARYLVEGPQPNGYQGGGIDAFNDKARQITAENIANVGQGIRQPSSDADLMPETPDAPPSAVAASSALAGPMGQRRVYEVFNGQRFELPEQSDKTPFGEDYDAIYRGLLETGEDPHKAMQYVAAQYKADQTQQHIADRTADQIEARRVEAERSRPDVAKLDEWLNRRLHQSDVNSQRAARAHMASAGAGPVAPVVPELIRMTEEGAPASEVYTKAAEAKVSPKQFQAPIQNVVRNAAAGERAGMKRDALTATDDKGNVIGVWRDANSAKIGSQQIERFHRVQERLEALIKHVEAQGDRVLTPEQVQERLSLGSAVVAALRPFNELSNTAAGQKAEELIVGALGAPGHGFLMGANANILRHLLTEATGQYRANLNTKLRPGGGSQLAPALGGPRRGGGEIPPGAVMGTLNGKRGYVLDGKFTAVE